VPRRALTLIEVLAATVLLATIAAACLPVIATAREHLISPKAPTISVDDLALIADELIADPASLGATDLTAPEPFEFTLTDDRVGTIAVRRLDCADSEVRHAWVSFEAGGASVFRWIALPAQEPEGGEP
jgi:prepilin-type N-terminal cleavage/methylation domain-containing protein